MEGAGAMLASKEKSVRCLSLVLRTAAANRRDCAKVMGNACARQGSKGKHARISKRRKSR